MCCGDADAPETSNVSVSVTTNAPRSGAPTVSVATVTAPLNPLRSSALLYAIVRSETASAHFPGRTKTPVIRRRSPACAAQSRSTKSHPSTVQTSASAPVPTR